MMIRRYWLRTALALTGIATMGLAGPASAKDWKNVTIALEGAYAPWNLTNPDGTMGGFEPELADVICKSQKIECKLIAQDWDGMITALNAGKFDVMMDSVSITEERKQVIDFSLPYASTPATFASLKDSKFAGAPGTGTVLKLDPELSGGKDAIEALKAAFKGATIGIQAATVYSKFVYDNFGSIATVREYKTGGERDLDLESGRLDLAFDDATYLKASFEKSAESMDFSGPEIGGTIFGAGQGLGLRKADTDLKAILDAGIKAAIADGTVKTLSEKWFKTDVTP